jgi:5-methylcytosine-specific restriction protein A
MANTLVGVGNIMPSKPLKSCAHFGCPELTHNRYCDKHMKIREDKDKERRSRYDKNRPNHHHLYHSKRWRDSRLLFLRDNPLCIECEKPANMVDHIKPHLGNYQLFWDRSNWQPMCASCHAIKTCKEDGGFGNKKG